MSDQFAGKTSYELGYARGIREGRDASNVYEQDFAYHPEDYTRGYWDGFGQAMFPKRGTP